MTGLVACRTSQSLPLCKGRWHGFAVPEGIYVVPFRIGLLWIDKPVPRNPSVKNQRFLTAPFAQGSLWALRFPFTQGGLASPSGRCARRAERALSVSFADSSPKGGAKGAAAPALHFPFTQASLGRCRTIA